MKIILSGHEGSKKILGACKYLIDKYAPGFLVHFLNYGRLPLKQNIAGALYVCIADHQHEGPKQWTKDVANFLGGLTDETIIFGLDDYLISGPADMERYQKLLDVMMIESSVICARLCQSALYKTYECEDIGDEIIRLTDMAEYSATTQYCIWRREDLIRLLEQCDTPWDFELRGSRLLNESGKKVIGMRDAIIPYSDCSALSKKWGDRTKVAGLKAEDIDELVNLGLLDKESIIE